MGYLMTWCVFVDQVEWQAYHGPACAAQGVPRPGYLAADDATVMIDACWTTAWVQPYAIWLGQSMHVIADVPPEDVAAYSLLELLNAPVFPAMGSGDVTLDYAGQTWTVQPVEFVYEQARPPTWVDPKTGIEYAT